MCDAVVIAGVIADGKPPGRVAFLFGIAGFRERWGGMAAFGCGFNPSICSDTQTAASHRIAVASESTKASSEGSGH
jgi:hypothetical protein